MATNFYVIDKTQPITVEILAEILTCVPVYLTDQSVEGLSPEASACLLQISKNDLIALYQKLDIGPPDASP